MEQQFLQSLEIQFDCPECGYTEKRNVTSKKYRNYNRGCCGTSTTVELLDEGQIRVTSKLPEKDGIDESIVDVAFIAIRKITFVTPYGTIQTEAAPFAGHSRVIKCNDFDSPYEHSVEVTTTTDGQILMGEWKTRRLSTSDGNKEEEE